VPGRLWTVARLAQGQEEELPGHGSVKRHRGGWGAAGRDASWLLPCTQGASAHGPPPPSLPLERHPTGPPRDACGGPCGRVGRAARGEGREHVGPPTACRSLRRAFPGVHGPWSAASDVVLNEVGAPLSPLRRPQHACVPRRSVRRGGAEPTGIGGRGLTLPPCLEGGHAGLSLGGPYAWLVCTGPWPSPCHPILTHEPPSALLPQAQTFLPALSHPAFYLRFAGAGAVAPRPLWSSGSVHVSS